MGSPRTEGEASEGQALKGSGPHRRRCESAPRVTAFAGGARLELVCRRSRSVSGLQVAGRRAAPAVQVCRARQEGPIAHNVPPECVPLRGAALRSLHRRPLRGTPASQCIQRTVHSGPRGSQSLTNTHGLSKLTYFVTEPTIRYRPGLGFLGEVVIRATGEPDVFHRPPTGLARSPRHTRGSGRCRASCRQDCAPTQKAAGSLLLCIAFH